MPTLNVVLMQPQIPQNTGNIARTCAATGSRLHLVGPLGFSIDDRQLKRAGLDYWHMLDITCYADTAEFFAANEGAEFFYYSTKAKKCFSLVDYPDNCWLVFGREDAGIDEKLLGENPKTALRIPMLDAARSLNLSNAVAVGVFEVLRSWGYPSLSLQGRMGCERQNP